MGEQARPTKEDLARAQARANLRNETLDPELKAEIVKDYVQQAVPAFRIREVRPIQIGAHTGYVVRAELAAPGGTISVEHATNGYVLAHADKPIGMIARNLIDAVARQLWHDTGI